MELKCRGENTYINFDDERKELEFDALSRKEQKKFIEEMFIPKTYKDLGTKKCSSGHYSHMTRIHCVESECENISETEIDYNSAVDLEDEVFDEDSALGPTLDDFGIIKCTNGHFRWQRGEYSELNLYKKCVFPIESHLSSSVSTFDSEPKDVLATGPKSPIFNFNPKTDDLVTPIRYSCCDEFRLVEYPN